MPLDLDFSPANGYGADHLPMAVIREAHGVAGRVVTRIDDTVIDLARLAEMGVDLGFDIADNSGTHVDVLHADNLNALLAKGHEAMANLRGRLGEIITNSFGAKRYVSALRPLATVEFMLPIAIKNYVDFYSSLQHATNLGRLFRPEGDPLTPNWRHLPIGYHGRSSTVAVSDTPVGRPSGLRLIEGRPVFGPSLRLDIEAEVGFVIGKDSQLGSRIGTREFFDYVAGVVLVNDWSARDIQGFEYQPLGPFLGKSFLTSISAWLTPIEALARARTKPVTQDPIPAEYLLDPDPWSLDIELAIELNGTVISRPPFASTYWTPGQQLAHQTVNGANVCIGDLFASGTISGERSDQFGSLIELTSGGVQPLSLLDQTSRVFLEDGDSVTIRASAPSLAGGRLSMGEVRGIVVGPSQ